MRIASGRARAEAAARLAAEVTSYALKVPQDAIMSRARGSSTVALARQVAMYLCHVAFELSIARTGEAFQRDRSTVAHACHAIEDRREDESFDAWIDGLEGMLRCARCSEAPASVVEALR